MCAAGLPKYSSKLRETFHQINPHHISCTYKALFEDHALNVLRSVSDVEDATNVCLLDPPELRISPIKPRKPRITRYQCNSIACGDGNESPVPRLGVYSTAYNGDLAPLASHNVNYRPDCQLLHTSFLNNSSIKTSHDALNLRDQAMSPWQTCCLIDSERCSTFHDSEKILTVPTINTTGRSPAILNPLPFSHPSNVRTSAESPTKLKRQAAPSKDTKSKQNTDDTPTKTTKMRVTHEYYPRKEEISYPFSHGEVHLGHIKQYRENVTKVNLQQGLFRCSQQYAANMKERSKMLTATNVLMNTVDLAQPSYTKHRLSKLQLGAVKGHKCSIEQAQDQMMGLEGQIEQVAEGKLSPCSDCYNPPPTPSNEVSSSALDPRSTGPNSSPSSPPTKCKSTESDPGQHSGSSVKKRLPKVSSAPLHDTGSTKVCGKIP